MGGYSNTNAIELGGTWRLEQQSLVLIDADPPARDSTGLAYDASRDVIVMFGGNGSGCAGAQHCDETWEYIPAY